MRNLLLLLLILASLLIMAGVVAKVQHWPFANFMMGAGLVVELICAIGFVVISWRKRKSA